MKNKWEKWDSNYNQYLNPAPIVYPFTMNFSQEQENGEITELTMCQIIVKAVLFPPHNNPIR